MRIKFAAKVGTVLFLWAISCVVGGPVMTALLVIGSAGTIPDNMAVGAGYATWFFIIWLALGRLHSLAVRHGWFAWAHR